MAKFIFAFISTFLLGASSYAAKAEKVFFVSPTDGATVSQTFEAQFGEEGLKVKPAGKDIAEKDAGHFHVLIDQDAYPAGQVIPTDATHLHYGKAQKKATLTLSPGTHKLTLQFADGAHRSNGEALSQTITVHVK